jgi:hypothetical protein
VNYIVTIADRIIGKLLFDAKNAGFVKQWNRKVASGARFSLKYTLINIRFDFKSRLKAFTGSLRRSPGL